MRSKLANLKSEMYGNGKKAGPRLHDLAPGFLCRQGDFPQPRSHFLPSLYRVTLVVEYLGWVDIDLDV